MLDEQQAYFLTKNKVETESLRYKELAAANKKHLAGLDKSAIAEIQQYKILP